MNPTIGSWSVASFSIACALPCSEKLMFRGTAPLMRGRRFADGRERGDTQLLAPIGTSVTVSSGWSEATGLSCKVATRP